MRSNPESSKKQIDFKILKISFAYIFIHVCMNEGVNNNFICLLFYFLQGRREKIVR